MKIIAMLPLLLTLAACASSRPSNPDNVCHMFEERRSWYRAAEQTEQRWGVPVPVTMAFIYQESAFNSRARPNRTKVLWVIPWTRPSTAQGYAQALNSTWAQYQQETGNRFADRSNFSDAVDFIGWYNHYSVPRSGIALNDARNLYLAYHEGHTGFNRGTYQNKGWLLETATAVERNAVRYQTQYASCRDKLGRRWWHRLLS